MVTGYHSWKTQSKNIYSEILLKELHFAEIKKHLRPGKLIKEMPKIENTNLISTHEVSISTAKVHKSSPISFSSN